MFENQLTRGTNHGWWVGAVFVALAVSFICDWWGDRKIIREQPVVQERFYSTHPVREPFVEAQTKTAGFEYACNSCHALMKPPQEPRKLMAEHEEIVMKHEPGMSCYTCHNREDRDMLNDIYGRLVSFEQSENVCRRCHGPRFRDWKRGIHGRPSGYWDEAKGEFMNVTCVYCHNPHEPHFDPMQPSPPPSRDDFMKKDNHTETHHER
jgi:hypothetical protein